MRSVSDAGGRGAGRERLWGGQRTFTAPVQGQEVQSASVAAKQPYVTGKDSVSGNVGAKTWGPPGVVRTGWESPVLPLGTDTVSITAPGLALMMSSCKHWVIIP